MSKKTHVLLLSSLFISASMAPINGFASTSGSGAGLEDDVVAGEGSGLRSSSRSISPAPVVLDESSAAAAAASGSTARLEERPHGKGEADVEADGGTGYPIDFFGHSTVIPMKAQSSHRVFSGRWDLGSKQLFTIAPENIFAPNSAGAFIMHPALFEQRQFIAGAVSFPESFMPRVGEFLVSEEAEGLRTATLPHTFEFEFSPSNPEQGSQSLTLCQGNARYVLPCSKKFEDAYFAIQTSLTIAGLKEAIPDFGVEEVRFFPNDNKSVVSISGVFDFRRQVFAFSIMNGWFDVKYKSTESSVEENFTRFFSNLLLQKAGGASSASGGEGSASASAPVEDEVEVEVEADGEEAGDGVGEAAPVVGAEADSVVDGKKSVE